eukprot:gb/GEZJ01002663.1/.p2 GENE.gb/GEZJ01002663.1/~~gb/GEZJ01002663.1/.p2  ORF type:complete len:406 (-),score=63.32 gb/GEZJ01002663.1/:1771-2988(-)
MSVLIETSLGDIVLDLYDSVAPNTCLNFLKLCKIKYYNDCEFFRIEKGFVAQTGDPNNDGTGGVSVFATCQPPWDAAIKPEISLNVSHTRKGTVSMTASAAQTGAPKAHGSQFFITLADDLAYLDGTHTIIGRVEEGIQVLDKLAETDVDDNFRPYRVIRIRHTIILYDPFDDPAGLPQDCPSPDPAQTVPDDRLASDEEIDEDVDDEVRAKLVQELQAEREARSRAEVLEMIGDIADADLKPPDNVLFICKLNPVTQAEDLEIIFSRFGHCTADILRDKETGDSLCYGFIEFENKQQCERAFFKMENAVIDDRRVLVDFSQSVSKLWNARRRSQPVKSEEEKIISQFSTPPLLSAAPNEVPAPGASLCKPTDGMEAVPGAENENTTWEVRKKRRRGRSRFENAG